MSTPILSGGGGECAAGRKGFGKAYTVGGHHPNDSPINGGASMVLSSGPCTISPPMPPNAAIIGHHPAQMAALHNSPTILHNRATHASQGHLQSVDGARGQPAHPMGQHREGGAGAQGEGEDNSSTAGAGNQLGCKNPNKLFGVSPSDIDKYSRVVFPVCFVCFNLMYWVIYIHISAIKTQDLESGWGHRFTKFLQR